MTASQLKARVDATGSYFFTRKSMKFFGDTMRNYGVTEITVRNMHDKKIKVFELYRRRPVNHRLQGSAFFCVKTFERIHAKDYHA